MRILLAFFFCTCLLSYEAFAQKVLLNLEANDETSLETEYRYTQVLDHRLQKFKIGEVFEREGYRLPVTFRGNLDQLATQFFSESIDPTDSADQEIQVRILEMDLTEVFNAETELYEGEVHLGLGFFRVGTFEPVHLLDYAGSTQYQRSGFRMDRVEELVNRLFYNSVTYFDTWIKSQVLSNRSLARDFRLDIVEQDQVSTEDKVFYESDRPLVWGDFKARPNPGSRNNATIFSSFSLGGVSLMDSGSVVQTLEINVYMLPRQSWVKVPSDYALNHEQRHFDVVRIVADRLIHRLENAELNLDFYQAIINDAYLDAYREMNRLQELYEKGTNHGLNPEGQATWNVWIDEALRGNWEKIERALRTLEN